MSNPDPGLFTARILLDPVLYQQNLRHALGVVAATLDDMHAPLAQSAPDLLRQLQTLRVTLLAQCEVPHA